MSSEKKSTRAVWAVFWRLFNDYAMKYRIRLFAAILSVLIMGGAIHVYYRFLDFGVSTLLDGFSAENVKKEQSEEHIVQRLAKNGAVRWILKKTGLDFSEGQAPKTEPKAPKTGDKVKSAKESKSPIAKLNRYCERFGIHLSEDQSLSFPLVCIMIAFALVFFLINTMSAFFNKYLLGWLGARIVTDMRIQLYDVFQKQNMSFFDHHTVGELMSRCTSDTSVVSAGFTGSLSEALIAPMQMLIAVVFVLQKAMGAGLGKPILFLLLAMPVTIIPVYIISRKLRQYQIRVLSRVAEVLKQMQEKLSGIRVVKAFNREAHESERFRDGNEYYFKSIHKALLTDLCIQPSMQLTALLLSCVFLLLCLYYQVPLGALVVIGYAAQNAYKPIKELARLNTNLQKCAAAAERIFDTLDNWQILPEAEHPQPVKAFTDKVVFEHVTFSYNKNERVILKDFSLEIKKGQMVALVGATGCGKSTLANLLPRFYDPDEGRILIDGVDIRDMSNSDLKALIGTVAQDTFLFNETIAYNINYGRLDATDDEIKTAAKQADAYEFIMQEKEGFNRSVGERGQLLSGGQRQRLAIARAILKNPPIMILDEATSALDTETEKQVQAALTTLMKDRTVLAIAHRLSTIVNADKIVVVDNGEIVEQGTHQELYDLNGRYRRLYDLQAPAGKA